jgi:metal-responsive CopG/Arc/MetJ family transcriptional regulator
MAKTKIAVTLDVKTVKKIDILVKKNIFPNRSKAIQEALQEKIKKMEHGRLARECSKLDSAFEKALAEEGISEELNEWPEY